MPEFKRFQALPDAGVYLMDHVPTALRKSVFKSFAAGFQQGLEAIANVLRRGRAPKIELVTSQLYISGDSRYKSFYLDKGGKVEYAIAAILWRSEEEHETLGDGSFCEVPAFRQKIAKLPVHALDDDYQFVRTKILGASFQPEPYPDPDFYEDSDCYNEDEDFGDWHY